jgi:hypothetical protein
MSKGALLIARNNSEVDYTKQAIFCAKRIKKYLDVPVSLITDNKSYLEKICPNYLEIFDKVIEIDGSLFVQYKKYNDGAFVKKNLEYKNNSRSLCFDLTPYNETLLLDTDFVLFNDSLRVCFDQTNDLLMYKRSLDLSTDRDTTEFKTISETGPDFYWATAIFFRKTQLNKIFFNLVKHIQDFWPHYKNLFQLPYSTFRNDYAFSIAVHIMNGYKQGKFVNPMPGTLYYSTDRDHIVEINNDNVLLLVEKQNQSGTYFPVRLSNSNIHLMNKINLNRIIDNAN